VFTDGKVDLGNLRVGYRDAVYFPIKRGKFGASSMRMREKAIHKNHFASRVVEIYH
jgi:hypothetical protein